MSVTHNLHNGEAPWLSDDRKADGSFGCIGFSFNLRRRKTSDGYTRLEGRIQADVKEDHNGTYMFTVYLNDDERKRMAEALLEGLT